jgi:hypothetical protein
MSSTEYHGQNSELDAQIIEALRDGLDAVPVTLPTAAPAGTTIAAPAIEATTPRATPRGCGLLHLWCS